jgi:hypothetical protein
VKICTERFLNLTSMNAIAGVFEQANRLPSGSRLLDVGAGSCPYRSFFKHCEYKTHDFAELEKEQLIGIPDTGKLTM